MEIKNFDIQNIDSFYSHEQILRIKEEIKTKLIQEKIVFISKTFNKIKINAKSFEKYSQDGYYESIVKEYVNLFPTLKDFVACYNSNLDHPPVCPYCKQEYCKLKANLHPLQYGVFCGKEECLQLFKSEQAMSNFFTDEANLKRKTTVKEVYGVGNISQNEEIKKKKAETCMLHYGVDSPFKSEEIRNKYIQTSIEKYGVDWPTKSREVIERRQITNLERYGYREACMNADVQAKVTQAVIDKYGYKSPLLHPDIQKKSEQTFENHYGEGIKKVWQIPNLVELSQQGQIKKHGCLYIQTPQGREMSRHTMKNNIKNGNIVIGKRTKYYYNNLYFDSSWELIYYFYNKNILNLDVERTPQSIPYIDSFYIDHLYFPDFKIENTTLIEVKGNHLLNFDENYNIVGLKYPFRSKTEEKYLKDQSKLDAKFECIKNNNVILITEKEINFYKNEIIRIYGRDFLKDLLDNKFN